MTNPLHVPANSDETLWVFALDLPDPDSDAVVEGGPGKTWPLKILLGATALKAGHIEHFPASDLAGVGLPGYLVEGLGVDAADIAPDRAQLDAADTHIVILPGAAFNGVEQTLDPSLPLRHLGTYQQIQTVQRLVPLPMADTDSVIPPTPGMAPAPQPRVGSHGLLGLLAAAVVVLILAYFLFGAGA